SDAGALRDQRYADINRLSQLVPIRVIDHGTGGVDVYLGNDSLIIPGQTNHLATANRGDRGVNVLDVTVAGSNSPITGTKGALAGTIGGRDNVVGGLLDKLDQFTSTGSAQTSTTSVDLAAVNPKTTLTNIVNQLSGIANVTASINADGRLAINTTNGYEIEFASDNSGALASLGINTFFTGSSSLD